jgi:hypothetical protein
MLSDFQDELKSAVVVAEASTKALGRSVLVGTIPIIEFGLLIGFTLLIVAVPGALMRRLKA